ncbi:MAG: cytochrome b/b6 domain-containing protein [Desulfobacterales bacterium]
MNHSPTTIPETAANAKPRLVVVWDLPTRLFHWLLVAFVITSFVTVEIGGNAMRIHEWSGFTILALLFFRVGWGFLGSRTARFTTFVRGPKAVWIYARTLRGKESPLYFGHNPLGGWSILAMLTALFVQAGSGLFANDEIMTEGPLYGWVSKATSNIITHVHEWNQGLLVTLVAVHVLAIVFYFVVKRENLLAPMITGRRTWQATIEAQAGRAWAAVAIAAAAAGAVYLLVR